MKENAKKENVKTIIDELTYACNYLKEHGQNILTNQLIENELEQIETFFGVNQQQALFLIAMFHNELHERTTTWKNLCEFLKVSPLKMLQEFPELKYLRDECLIQANDRCDRSFNHNSSLQICEHVMDAIVQNKPELIRESIKIECFADLCFWFSSLMKKLRNKDIMPAKFYKNIVDKLHTNQNLPSVEIFRKYELDNKEIAIMLSLLVEAGQECNNGETSLSGILTNLELDLRQKVELKQNLVGGTSNLIVKELMEFTDYSFFAGTSDYVQLTEKSMKMFFDQNSKTHDRKISFKVLEHITQSSINNCNLFYNTGIDKEMQKINRYMKEEELQRITSNLKQNGLQSGIAILFYGSPGTGKTESILQLAKQSGRDVLRVDIPKIRNMYVGESEKNIKKIFSEYAKALSKMSPYPILLFNESDALFGKRIDVSQSVDQMNNSMQNILLQEMEKFEGILIATTNMTNNIDAAFERRFLYKVCFTKPDVQTKAKIWKDKIPELEENLISKLAESYDYSGGEIVNICRKLHISKLLDQTEINSEFINELCNQELIQNGRHANHIGFANRI